MRKMGIPLAVALTGAAAWHLSRQERPQPVLEERAAIPIQAPISIKPSLDGEVGKFSVYNLSDEEWDRIQTKSKEERVHGKKWHYRITREHMEDGRGYFVYLADQKETYSSPSDKRVYAVWLKWLLKDAGVKFDLQGY